MTFWFLNIAFFLNQSDSLTHYAPYPSLGTKYPVIKEKKQDQCQLFAELNCRALA